MAETIILVQVMCSIVAIQITLLSFILSRTSFESWTVITPLILSLSHPVDSCLSSASWNPPVTFMKHLGHLQASFLPLFLLKDFED